MKKKSVYRIIWFIEPDELERTYSLEIILWLEE